MEQEWSQQDRESAVSGALKRSATDPSFRQLLLTDANAAVQEVAGKPLPSGFKVRVLERDGYDATFVLPEPVTAGGELSDAELEQVAGGRGACGVSCGIGTNVEG